jgi:aminoglycoside phosphotransferase (APT) family kinase protein
MSQAVDGAATVRTGEALDRNRLQEWLAQRVPAARNGIGISQFPLGHSNLTYLITVGPNEFVLRRPPFGNAVPTAHDMSREFRVLSALSPVFPEAPVPLAFCEDVQVLGAPFYLMERRRGVILRQRLPGGMALAPELADRLSGSVVGLLARLHGVDHRAIGLGDWGRPAGYVTRQVAGWTERYAGAATGPLPEMDAVAAWLAARVPVESGAAVLHNDWKFDNLLLHPGDLGRITAVFDWEMATIGDPLMDLGTALAYWIEADDPPELRAAAMGPTHAPGMWRRQQIVEEYIRATGRPVGDIAFYYAFGLFKVAVIVQQIFARYHRGATQDPRFATMDRLVGVLSRHAARVVEQGSL